MMSVEVLQDHTVTSDSIDDLLPWRDIGPPSISREGKRTQCGDKQTMGELKALAELQESDLRLQELMNSIPIMMWTSGRDSRSNYFNKCWLEFTGRSLREEMGSGWMDGVHPDDLHGCLRACFEVRSETRECRAEYRLRRRDGQYRWVLDQCVPRIDPSGKFAGYVGVCIDVTERKAIEEAVQDLGGRLINAQEAERARIARELHDNIGQRVAMLSIDAELIKQDLPASQTELRLQLDSLCRHTAELSGDIRRLSHQLHSAMLDHVGLLAASRDLCKQVGQQNGIYIEVLDRDLPASIPSNIALTVFRILQESLNNLVKHSGVCQARVEVKATGGMLCLTVSDTGVGFDPATIKPGLGLISMKERVRLLGGRFALRSALNAGTDVMAEVPLSDTSHCLATNPLSDTGASYAQAARAVGR